MLYSLNGLAGPLPVDDPGLSGFFNDLFKGNIAKAFTPPGGKINRIQPLGFVAKVLPTPVRKAFRYSGAAVQSTFAPVLSGAQQRRAFGLNPSESKVFMKWQQGARIAAAVIATYGTASYLATPAASTVGAAGAAPAGAPLGFAAAPTYTGFGSAAYAPAGFATPASFGGAGTAISPVAYASPSILGAAASDGISTSLALPTATAPTGFGSSGYLASQGVVAPTAFGAAPVASSPGFLSATGKALGSGAKFVGKTFVTTTAAGYVARMMNPQQPGQTYVEGEGGYLVDGSGQAQDPGQATPYIIGGGGSGGSGEQSSEEILAGPSLPIIIAVVGVAVTIGVKALRKSRRAK